MRVLPAVLPMRPLTHNDVRVLVFLLGSKTFNVGMVVRSPMLPYHKLLMVERLRTKGSLRSEDRFPIGDV